MYRRGLFLLLALPFLAGCVGQLGTSWPALYVLPDGNIFVAYESQIDLVDPVSGEPVVLMTDDGDVRTNEDNQPLVWNLNGGDANNAQFFANPIPIEDNRLLVPSYDRRLLTVDLDDAEFVGTDGVLVEGRGNAVTDLTRVDDTIFMGLQDQLIALGADSFEPLWSVETEHSVWASPIVLNGVVYFSSLDHFLYAADFDSGEVIWSLDLEGASAGVPVLAVEAVCRQEGDPVTQMVDLSRIEETNCEPVEDSDPRLYVGSFGNKVFEVSLGGEVLSEYQTVDWIWSTPTLVDGVLYVGDVAGTVYALETDDGLTEDWATDVADGAIRMAPAVFEDYVIVGSRDQSLYWLNRETGVLVDARELSDEILSDILVFNDFTVTNDAGREVDAIIVIATLAANRELLVAYPARPEDGSQRIWTFNR